jgi:hypothetical protein
MCRIERQAAAWLAVHGSLRIALVGRCIELSVLQRSTVDRVAEELPAKGVPGSKGNLGDAADRDPVGPASSRDRAVSYGGQ